MTTATRVLQPDDIAELKAWITREVERLRGNIPERSIGSKEAAAMLGVHPNTIYKLVKQREIPFHKNGKTLFFLPSELHAYMKQL